MAPGAARTSCQFSEAAAAPALRELRGRQDGDLQLFPDLQGPPRAAHRALPVLPQPLPDPSRLCPCTEAALQALEQPLYLLASSCTAPAPLSPNQLLPLLWGSGLVPPPPGSPPAPAPPPSVLQIPVGKLAGRGSGAIWAPAALTLAHCLAHVGTCHREWVMSE